jgi:hypothetical protein
MARTPREESTMGEEEVRLIKSSAFTDAQLREMLRWWELRDARRRREERDREDGRRRERFRLLAAMAGTAVVTSLAVTLVIVIGFAPRRPPEIAGMVVQAPTTTTVERTEPRASVANGVESPNVAVPPAAVTPARADISTPVPAPAVSPSRTDMAPPPRNRSASPVAHPKPPESHSPVAAASELSTVAAPLTPSELAGAQRRVERLLQEATTPEKKAELQGKQTVAETWIQAIGFDGARVKARNMARAFMAVVNAAEAEKGSRSPEFAQAAALVKYWRDVSDLVIVATPSSRS